MVLWVQIPMCLLPEPLARGGPKVGRDPERHRMDGSTPMGQHAAVIPQFAFELQGNVLCSLVRLWLSEKAEKEREPFNPSVTP